MFPSTRSVVPPAVALLIALFILPALRACRSGDSAATAVPTLAAVPTPAAERNLQVTLTTDPTPPTAGPVKLIVEVTDWHDNPVNGAKVSLAANHTGASHGGIAGDLIAVGEGRYQAEGTFSMSGTWRVEVKVSKDGMSPITTTVDLPVR